MKIALVIFGATLIGTVGGYIWSGHTPAAHAAAAAAPVPMAVASVEPADSPTAEDRAWSSRASAGSSPPSLGHRRAVEQSVFYAGCNEARAAGAAPIYAGQPGYRVEMDGDSDGIACEPHPGL